jgi:hypothetical protein
VFDLTDSLGVLYFLLARSPGTQFVHASMAISPPAQQLVIAQLRQSRPPLVVYDSQLSTTDWDGITPDVRHYELSQYILDGWAPVLRTHGYLLLLRKDLLARSPALPALSAPPQTTDLYFSSPTCDWGATPNFLPTTPSGSAVRVPVTPVGSQVYLDATGLAPPASPSVVVLADGAQALLSLTVNQADFRVSGVFPGSSVTIYALGGDGRLHPMAGTGSSPVQAVRLTDGRTAAVAASPLGTLTSLFATVRTVGRLDLPAGLRLADYPLATLSTVDGPIGAANVTLTAGLGDGARSIAAQSLAQTTQPLPIRVGSCPQWYGYGAAGPVYVTQDGGAPITAVTLSGLSP